MGKEGEKEKSRFALYVKLLGCWLPEGGQNGDGNEGTEIGTQTALMPN